jgi:Secretion system C-terminal sorting domain
MKSYVFFLWTLVFTLSNNSLKAQVANIRISNPSIVSGTIFQFDVEMQATSGAIYLGNTDIKFNFDATKFASTTISRVSATATLKNAAGVNVSYSVAASVTSANTVTVNINSPAPADQADFDDRVAKITNTYARIATFRMQTFSGATAAAALLACQSSGTIVYSISPTDPFAESLVTTTFGSVLPLDLLSFTGKQNAEGITLNWKTAHEQNVGHFIVEKSMDAADKFVEIGNLKAVSNAGETPQYYSLFDAQPSTLNYYRLKIVDNDGGFTYSKTIAFKNQNKSNDIIAFYPNPVTNVLNVVLTNTNYKTATVSLVDITGRVILTQTKTFDSQPFILTTENCGNGIYTAIVAIDGTQSMHKVVIAK